MAALTLPAGRTWRDGPKPVRLTRGGAVSKDAEFPDPETFRLRGS